MPQKGFNSVYYEIVTNIIIICQLNWFCVFVQIFFYCQTANWHCQSEKQENAHLEIKRTCLRIGKRERGGGEKNVSLNDKQTSYSIFDNPSLV